MCTGSFIIIPRQGEGKEVEDSFRTENVTILKISLLYVIKEQVMQLSTVPNFDVDANSTINAKQYRSQLWHIIAEDLSN